MEESLSLHIGNIIDSFIENKNIVDLFVNRKTLPYWIKGLTHESINYKENYEKYEFLGDSTLGYAFNLYLRDVENIKDLSKTNNLLNYYMSKQYQPTIARKIGLDKIIIIHPNVKISDDILEDVFESFFGIFTFICRKLWQSYSGDKDSSRQLLSPVQYLINFFSWYFSKISQIDRSKGEPISKNFFQEFYYFFSGESTQRQSSWYYNSKNKSFVFNPEFTKTIGLYSKDLENITLKILTKKNVDSEQIYLDNISDSFKNMGFDLDWLNYEKSKVTFNDNYKALAKENKYTRFILSRNNKNSYDLLAQTVDPKTRESISTLIYSFDDSLDFINLKEKAMKILDEKFIK